MNRRFIFLSLLILTVLGPGCGLVGLKNEVRFETVKQVYSPGEQINMLLENDTSSKVGLNLCFAFLSLEQQVSSDKWERISVGLGPDENRACTSEMILLSPGKTTGGVAHLPENQVPGIYRIATRLEMNNKGFEAATNSFEVQ